MQYLANISQFESLMNSAHIQNGFMQDGMQRIKKWAIPLAAGGAMLAGCMGCNQTQPPNPQQQSTYMRARVNQQQKQIQQMRQTAKQGQRQGGRLYPQGALSPGVQQLRQQMDSGPLINNFRQILFNARQIRKVLNEASGWEIDGIFRGGADGSWHHPDEIPPVDPDDGWNDLRRENPDCYRERGLVTPDDGNNWLRMAAPDKFRMEEACLAFREWRLGRGPQDMDYVAGLVKTILSMEAKGAYPFTEKAEKEIPRAQKLYDKNADIKEKIRALMDDGWNTSSRENVPLEDQGWFDEDEEDLLDADESEDTIEPEESVYEDEDAPIPLEPEWDTELE